MAQGDAQGGSSGVGSAVEAVGRCFVKGAVRDGGVDGWNAARLCSPRLRPLGQAVQTALSSKVRREAKRMRMRMWICWWWWEDSLLPIPQLLHRQKRGRKLKRKPEGKGKGLRLPVCLQLIARTVACLVGDDHPSPHTVHEGIPLQVQRATWGCMLGRASRTGLGPALGRCSLLRGT